ncbi:sensor histidine kinase [Mucilaginibacter sp.]|uniref:sensor histidine kinase n=1 Tax=Mucilaginibacter sp. TaxID=1882438 RepID=UPI003D0C2F9B
MKIIANRYLIPIMSGIILLAVCLQLIWLDQLFKKQYQLVEEELEQVVNKASRETMYKNLLGDISGNGDYRQFFLSPRWINLKTAFDAITDSEVNRYLNSSFASSAFRDSVVVNIHLQVYSGKAAVNHVAMAPSSPKQVSPGMLAIDQRSVLKMDSTVKVLLKQADLNVDAYYGAFRYRNNDEQITYSINNPVTHPAFRSRKYSYDLRSKNKYELIVPGLDSLVLWRMRIYICSAFVLILLIGFACYYILKSIANKQLYAEAKAAFTNNMSHELKTPLAIIEVALDSITRYNLLAKPEKLNTYLEISKTELQRLKQMIDKALRLDDLDKGNIKLHQELYDVQQCLKLVVASMSVQVINKNATIIYEPLEEPCFVSGDPVHLTNVFYNLIENALKYGQAGVHVVVVCTSDANTVKISIKDNGPGIEAIYHDKIFERFFRVSSAYDVPHVEGSGLGLNYVKQIIEMHGGSVNVQSEKGKGSKFMVYLPVFKQL